MSEQEHESLKHDKFCPISDPSAGVPYCGCARIEMIRRDERERIENERSPIWSEAMDAD